MEDRENRVGLKCEGPSLTKQAFKQECDINHIMKKFKKVAGAEYLTQYQGYVQGQFGDFSHVSDYRSALEQISKANDMFMALPSLVRKKFDNDAAVFLDYCQNPANIDELVKLGLATKKVVVDNVSTDEKK